MSETIWRDCDQVVSGGEFRLVGLREVFGDGGMESPGFEGGDGFFGGQGSIRPRFDFDKDEGVGSCGGVQGDDVDFTRGCSVSAGDDGVALIEEVSGGLIFGIGAGAFCH